MEAGDSSEFLASTQMNEYERERAEILKAGNPEVYQEAVEYVNAIRPIIMKQLKRSIAGNVNPNKASNETMD